MVFEVKLVVSFGVSDSKGVHKRALGDVNVLFHDLGADYMGNSLCELGARVVFLHFSPIHVIFQYVWLKNVVCVLKVSSSRSRQDFLKNPIAA